MPSFVCDRCQETLKKAKLDSHKQYCRQASFSCIDCYKSFKGDEYRAHTSCITEVQKYHGKPAQKPQNAASVKPVSAAVAGDGEEKKKEEPVSKKQKKEENVDKFTALLNKSLAEPKTVKELKKIFDDNDMKKDFEKRIQLSLLDGKITATIL